MKLRALLSLTVSFMILSGVAVAEDHHFYQKGTLAEMNSVECGVDEKSAQSIVGEVIGTDSAHRKTRQALCPEYVLKTDRVAYRIRPREEKNPALLPVGDVAEFRLKKDRLVLRVPEGDNKEREYTVVGITQINAGAVADKK